MTEARFTNCGTTHNKFRSKPINVQKILTTAVILENLQHTTVLAVVVFRRGKKLSEQLKRHFNSFEDKKRTYGSEKQVQDS